MNTVLDIDGCLADFALHFEKRLGKSIAAKMDNKITKEEWRVINNSDFWETIPALEGGTYLASLGPLTPNVYLLTSRPEQSRAATLRWLDSVGIRLYNEKHLLIVKPSGDKLPELNRLAPCAFIDDYLPIVAVADGYDNIDAQLMLQPWNERVVTHFAKVRSVRSVQQFIEGARK